MNELDDLRTLLEGEANRVSPDGSRRAGTVARTARRRTFRTWGAGAGAVVVALAALSGSGALVSVFERERRIDPAFHASPAPGWSPGVHPVLATGTHDGRHWTFHIVDVDMPGHPRGPQVVFEIEAPQPNVGWFYARSDWDTVDASFQGRIGGSGEYVMGMVSDEVTSVAVVLRNDVSIDAPIFGHAETRYFLAFLPRGTRGLVVARSQTGEVLGTSPLPGADRRTLEYRCPDDHLEEDELGDERFPVLGSGTYEDRQWIVSLIEDPDAAHPEDTESENPELMFEIEGPWPNAGAMETYGGWTGVSEPFYDDLAGDDAYAIGMASREAASVTVETDEGDAVAAELFDARNVPSEGTQVYVAFVPAGTSGDLVARDSTGAEIGRVPLGALPDAPFCKQ